MKFAFHCLTLAVALLATGCGTSSTTTTGPSLDRCGITVVNSMSSVGASGGTGRLAVTAGRECTWSMTSNVPWITARQPAGGQGDGGVEYVVAANTRSRIAPRHCRRWRPGLRGGAGGIGLPVRVCGQTTRTSRQKAAAAVSPSKARTGCNWTPTTSDEWITITNGGSRTGNDSVNFTVARNTGAARNGAIRVGGQVFSISQSAPQCRYQLSPITTSISGAGGSGAVTVTAAANCTWTATTNVPWISIVGGTNGTGNGSVSFTVQSQSRCGTKWRPEYRRAEIHRYAAAGRVQLLHRSRRPVVRHRGRAGLCHSFNSVGLHVEHERRACMGHRHAGERNGDANDRVHGRVEPGSGPDRRHHHRRSELHREPVRWMRVFARTGKPQRVGVRRRELSCPSILRGRL